MPSPGRHIRRQRRLWVVPVLVVIAGCVAWGLAGRRHSAPPHVDVAAERGSVAAATAAVRVVADPMTFVSQRRDIENPSNVNELIQAYGAWTTRSDAGPARLAIVDALLGHPSVRVGVAALLTAVELDKTPRQNDPLWRDLVHKLSGVWDAVTLTYGRDLVMLETRTKARDLVIESLADARPEKLADNQRPLLASDLIDLYPSLPADQKPTIDRGLAALAGTDVVDIMAGRGLSESGRLARERTQVLDHIKRNPVPEAPAEE